MNNKPFVHLHNHSEFSMLDSNNRVSDLAKKAREYGMPAVGLTDHGNLFGLPYFESACHNHNIKPILGCEVYVAPQSRKDRNGSVNDERRYYHLCLYCKNHQGYLNLMKLTSLAYTEGFYYRPRVDDELLERYSKGLICSSACLAGEIAVYLLDNHYEKAKNKALFYQKIFGVGNYYLEIQDHGLPRDKELRIAIKKLAEETKIPMIVTNDVHYMEKSDEVYNDIFICIGTQKKYNDKQRMHASPQCYFRSPDEMYELFSDIPEALENTVKLSDQCNVKIPKPGPLLPEYHVPLIYKSTEEYFRHLVQQGLLSRYKVISKPLQERAEFEVSTIIKMEFVEYFLIVWDFIDWARSQKISIGPGRGSGAGSVVAYALKITDIDPIKYDLIFERFLNPERVNMPDFDIDFCDERRDEVVDYITQKYGRDNVAGIVTYGTLATKAVLKDVARVLDISFAESNELTKLIPENAVNLTDALEKSERLRQIRDKTDDYQKLFDAAIHLEGLVRNVGTHACGKVIGRGAVSNYVPLIYDSKTSSINSAYESKFIEDCGLVKMDFLGLTTLSIIERCTKMVHQKIPNFDIDYIPEDDKATFDLFCQGRTHAIFQFESLGMQRILREAKPSSINDLMALNALYRPGPMQFIPQFIECKKNPEKIKYLHPSLEKILKLTYGVIVYQEQVMQVAQIFAGYSLGEADLLRRAMSKKKPEEMARQKQIFIQGAIQKGHSKEDARRLFEVLEPFAGYGFNKSHAAAYSVLAYKTAYLKANFPHEFLASVLTSQIKNQDDFKTTLNEIQNLNITIMAPDINYSGQYFEVHEGKIYYGLLGIKGLGSAVIDEILGNRQKNGIFEGFLDFVQRLTNQSIHRRILEVLIYGGLFDNCEKNYDRSTLIHNVVPCLKWVCNKREEESRGGTLFLNFEDPTFLPNYTFTNAKPLSLQDRLNHEKEILGFYVSGHPLDPYKVHLQPDTCTSILNNIMQNPDKKEQKFRILGLLRDISIRSTKKGTTFVKAVLEDYTGTLKLIAFQRVFEKYQELFLENLPILVTGILDSTQGNLQLIILENPNQLQDSKITQHDTKLKSQFPDQINNLQLSSNLVTHLDILLEETSISETNLKLIKDVILSNPGKTAVVFLVKKPCGTISRILSAPHFSIHLNNIFIEKLKNLGFVEDLQEHSV